MVLAILLCRKESKFPGIDLLSVPGEDTRRHWKALYFPATVTQFSVTERSDFIHCSMGCASRFWLVESAHVDATFGP